MDTATNPKRQLMIAGKRPYRNRVCRPGRHWGRPLRVDIYDSAGGDWTKVADCSLCRSTVARTDFMRVS